MSAERTLVLAEFARACRTATRSVSLYPATHPSIQGSLARVVASAGRLIPETDITLTVFPDSIAIDGETPERTDTAMGELAGLMHDRLIGTLRVDRRADGHDWHALLLLLARPSDELLDEGGIANAWAASGRAHFEIHEIDYAEVLREHVGGDAADWEQVIHMSIQAGQAPLDESALASLLGIMGDATRFGGLLEQLQRDDTIGGGDPDGDTVVSARTAAMLQIVRKMLEATSQWPQVQGKDVVLQTAADASSRLTPDMMLALINRARSPEAEGSALAGDVVDRITDDTVASFVAGSVAETGGASKRLAQAFEALVPEADRKGQLLDLAKQEADKSRLGQEQGFEEVWQSAVTMLTSYSDETYVSSEYARELSGTRTTAIDVERVSDDPPERVQAWLASVSDDALGQLDLALLQDVLRVENDPETWLGVARVVITGIEQRTKTGNVQDAHALAFAIVREIGEGGREAIHSGAESAINSLADGPLASLIVARLRTVEDSGVEPLTRLCRATGTPIIRPLAESLVEERDSRAIARLKELLFGFGSAGRDMVGRLKHSAHPEVRGTAIDLLRMFGGADALAELTTMLDDRDPKVRRNVVRAVAQFGTDEAFAELQRALLAGVASGRTIGQQLADLHSDSGKVKTPTEILNKPDKLTDQEFEILRRHPVDGAAILRQTPEIPTLAPIVAFEHHLRQDGTGYPFGLSRPTLNLGTVLCGIADVYDAMRSQRAYQQAFPTDRILAVLQRNNGDQFDQHLVRRFVQLVGIYPVGNLVRLNTGDVAVVVNAHAPDPYRPRVRVLLDDAGVPVQPRELNLWETMEGEASTIVAPLDPASYDIDPLTYL